jgi:hypothetical protein
MIARSLGQENVGSSAVPALRDARPMQKVFDPTTAATSWVEHAAGGGLCISLTLPCASTLVMENGKSQDEVRLTHDHPLKTHSAR